MYSHIAFFYLLNIPRHCKLIYQKNVVKRVFVISHIFIQVNWIDLLNLINARACVNVISLIFICKYLSLSSLYDIDKFAGLILVVGENTPKPDGEALSS